MSGRGRKKLGTTERLRKGIFMTGSNNRRGREETFSSDLLSTFGDDPELKAWIEAHQKDLDRANADGSIPVSDSELIQEDKALVPIRGDL